MLPFTIKAVIWLLILLAAVCSAQQVSFPVVVADRDERFIKNLNASHFRLSEDGVEQTIQSVQRTVAALSLGIVVDKSGSMQKQWTVARDFVVPGLVRALESRVPGDEFFVVRFADRVELASEFTNESGPIIDAVMQGEIKGPTVLWEAVHYAFTHLDRARNSRRAILLITDGDEDNRSLRGEGQV